MQLATARFAKNDLAKYPFLKETTEYVKGLSLRIEDLVNPEYAGILERATERVEEAILYALVSRKLQREDVEILSFPVAVVLAAATQDSFIKKRYALAEAKQAYNDMKGESKERIAALARNFGWNFTVNDAVKTPYEFSLRFTDYLRNTASLRDKKWKLVNRFMSNGHVHLSRSEAVRLISEEVRRHVEKRLETKDLPKLPPRMSEIVDGIKKLSVEKIGKAEMEGFPKTIVNQAFPPCIITLYQAFSSGRHLSHIGRFTLTSFLISVGMPPETVGDLFKNFSDFDERMTRYQVEHIAGERGSRTRYTPPKCETLQTHGVCTSPDETCQKIRHPLSYYRRKLKKP